MERFLDYIWEDLTEEQKKETITKAIELRDKELSKGMQRFVAENNKFQPQSPKKNKGYKGGSEWQK